MRTNTTISILLGVVILAGSVAGGGREDATRRAFERKQADAHRKIAAAHSKLADLARRQGFEATALESFKAVLEYDPDHREARERLGYERRGREWVRDADPPDARDIPAEFVAAAILRKVEEQREKTRRAVLKELLRLGDWCEKEDLRAEARIYLSRALALEPKDQRLAARIAALAPQATEDLAVPLAEAVAPTRALVSDERTWSYVREVPDGGEIVLPGGKVGFTLVKGSPGLTVPGAERPVVVKGKNLRASLPGLGRDGAAAELTFLEHPRFGTWSVVGTRALRAEVGRVEIRLVDADLDGDPAGPADLVVLIREGEVWVLPRLETLPLPDGFDSIDVDEGRMLMTVRSVMRVPRVEYLEALVLLNTFRRAGGMTPCVWDAELTAACEKHCLYMKKNGIISGAGKTHAEDPSLPGYSPEGARAAKNSANVTSDRPADVSMLETLTTFYHRLMMLQPGTRRVGIVREHGGQMIDVYSDCDAARPHDWPAVVPAPGAHDVPLAFTGEWPNPVPSGARTAGYLVTVYFGSEPVRIDGVAATLRADGEDVPFAASWPGRPAAERYPDNWNSIMLLPLATLSPLTRYEVEIRATVDGRPWTKAWVFRTGEHRAGATWRRLRR